MVNRNALKRTEKRSRDRADRPSTCPFWDTGEVVGLLNNRNCRERLRGPAYVACSRRIGFRHVGVPQLAVSGPTAHPTETEAGIVPGNQAVLLGRNIDCL